MFGTESTNLLCIDVRCGEVESEEVGIDVLTFIRIIGFCKNQKVRLILVIISLSSPLTSQRTITWFLRIFVIPENQKVVSTGGWTTRRVKRSVHNQVPTFKWTLLPSPARLPKSSPRLLGGRKAGNSNMQGFFAPCCTTLCLSDPFRSGLSGRLESAMHGLVWTFCNSSQTYL